MVIAPRFPRGPLLAAIILLFMSGVTDSSRAGTTPAALYETFGSGGVAGINLTNPPVGIGNLNINATNIVAGGGMVYFQSGATIYSSSAKLVGLNTVFTNRVAPTGLALRPMVSVPEPSSVGLALLGLTGSLAGHLFRRDRAATGRN